MVKDLTIGALALDWTRERLQRVSLEGLLQFAPETIVEIDIKIRPKLIDLINYMLLKYFYTGDIDIHLNSTRLKHKYGRNYLTIINWLSERGYITLQGQYSTRGYSKLWRLSPKSLHNIKRVIQKDPVLLRIWRKHHEEEIIKAVTGNSNELINNIDLLIRDLYFVRVDYEKALAEIEQSKEIGLSDERSYLKGLASILKIQEGDIYHQFDKWGRFHTNLTTISKTTRNNFITIRGEHIAELDIKCCQPHLLSLLIGKENIEPTYRNALLADNFYETFAHFAGWTRREAKKKLYEVLFGRYSGGDKIFAQVWPQTWEWIRKYKQENGYKSLAWALQRAESDLIFTKIIPEIRKYDSEIPLFTIHDSICIPESDLDRVAPIFYNIVQETLPFYNK